MGSSILAWDLRIIEQWELRLWSYDLRQCLVLLAVTKVSEGHTASISRPNDGQIMILLYIRTIQKITRRLNSGDHSLNFSCGLALLKVS
jgi:hypothetical protein